LPEWCVLRDRPEKFSAVAAQSQGQGAARPDDFRRVILAPRVEQIVEDRSFYASFVTPVEYAVECAGERISVQSDSVPLADEAILLAGRRWQAEAIYHDQRQVVVVPAQGKTPPRFTGTGGQIDPKIMQKMREILAGDHTYSYLSPKAIELLVAARTVFARTGLAVSDILSTGTEPSAA
jgi:ATP-dependent helicase Lhr and Lhr-like helicase